jgi:hypothetical protein
MPPPRQQVLQWAAGRGVAPHLELASSVRGSNLESVCDGMLLASEVAARLVCWERL